MYGRNSPPLRSIVEGHAAANAQMWESAFAEVHRTCLGVLEFQYRLASEWGQLLFSPQFRGQGPVWTVLFNAFHTSLFHYWSALNLTKNGFVGSARPLFRLIFEGLLISKFCASQKSTELFDSWFAGDPYLSISRHVFNRINAPQISELQNL